jgi:hypothetical protein
MNMFTVLSLRRVVSRKVSAYICSFAVRFEKSRLLQFVCWYAPRLPHWKAGANEGSKVTHLEERHITQEMA